MLKTERTILRPFRPEDAPDLYAFSRDRRVADAAGWPPHRSVEESRRIIASVFSAPDTFAVVEKGSGKVIGSAGFTGAARGAFGPSDEIGYALHPDWWGRGIMTAAAGEMCRLLFARADVHRVWASALAVNVGSWRVMEKIGMRREGTFREAIVIDGAYYDDLYYALLRQEFLS